MLCITIAGKKESESPGSFSSTLSYLQKINGVPEFVMGNLKLTDYCCLGSVEGQAAHQATQIPSTNQEEDSSMLKHIPDNGTDLPLVGREEPTTTEGGASGGVVTDTVLPRKGELKRQSSVVDHDGSKARVVSSKTLEHMVKIMRNDNAVKIYPSNIENLFNRGKITFSCSTLNESQCLQYLKSNLLDCKLSIAKAMSTENTLPKSRSKKLNKNKG